MKTYTITVNGVAYEVTVEEGTTGTTTQAAAPAPAASAKKAAPAPKKEAPAASAPKADAAAGSVKVVAPMPGKVLSIKADVGETVKKGEVIMMLEAMKMENEIVAPEDGTVASVAAVGTSVEAGDVLATLN